MFSFVVISACITHMQESISMIRGGGEPKYPQKDQLIFLSPYFQGICLDGTPVK